jgi:short-subunit dehydrogenase
LRLGAALPLPEHSPMEHATNSPLAVVTGASSGIGLELARVFAQHGYDLVIAAENDAIHDAARSLRATGAKVESVQADLATYEGVETLWGRVRATGPVAAIAINAGVSVGGAFLENELDDEINLINLNVTGAVHLAKRVLRDMATRNEGRVLFTSSIAAEAPGPFEAVYAASKAFLLSFSEALRNELKDTNITVTALQPGPTDTDIFRRAGMEDTRVAAGKKSDPADVARAGFEALMAGKDHVVAGSMKDKVQSAAAQVSPETIKAEMARKQAEPGSADR